MPEKRRKFSPQFKAEAVQLVVASGPLVAEVARELEINPGTLDHWVHAWRRDNPEPDTEMSPVERARLSELEAEVRRLRMENEFLKKSGGAFSESMQQWPLAYERGCDSRGFCGVGC